MRKCSSARVFPGTQKERLLSRIRLKRAIKRKIRKMVSRASKFFQMAASSYLLPNSHLFTASICFFDTRKFVNEIFQMYKEKLRKLSRDAEKINKVFDNFCK